jgi:hypothetical protein
MSDLSVLASSDGFSRERLWAFFQNFGNLMRSMVSSFRVNIADFSKRIIEFRPSLHPSVTSLSSSSPAFASCGYREIANFHMRSPGIAGLIQWQWISLG